MAAARSRQLLLDVFSSFVQADKASALSASTALPALAAQIAEATGKTKEVFGADKASKAQVESWLSKVDAEQEGDLQSLEQELQSKTYLAGPTPTAADIALLGALYPVVSKLAPSEQHAHPSVSRYVSHLSQLYPSGELIKAWEPTYEGMPPIQRKDPAQDKKEKSKAKAEAAAGASNEAKKQGKPEVAAAAGAAAAAAAGAEGSGKASKKEKKEKNPAAAGAAGDGKKKEKPAKGGGGGGGAAAEPAVPIPSMIDLRVGKIVDIQKHPDADALYLEKVDFGEADGPRTILSGLVNYVPIEDMRDRWVVGIVNLKPVAMRGIKSYGMLLCATAKEGKDVGVEPVVPPAGSEVGDRIEVQGYEGLAPLEQLNPKKKIFEAIQPSYTTTDDKHAAWVGPGREGSDDAAPRPRLLKTAKGVCYAANFAGATLS